MVLRAQHSPVRLRKLLHVVIVIAGPAGAGAGPAESSSRFASVQAICQLPDEAPLGTTALLSWCGR